MERIAELSGLSNDDLVSRSSTSIANSTYYPTAPSRVQSEDLVDVQYQIRALALQHGYPERQLRGRSLVFDQNLTVLLIDILNIIPADAADDDVWSFLTLNVCPDVALWRFPNDVDSEGTIRERYERLIGKPRNVFRRAWWRGFVLGKELSAQLLEDESVGIMERPSIGGNERLARAVASAHLAMLANAYKSSRQDLLREAIKRIRRRMGQISIYALSDLQLRDLIAEDFQLAARSLGGRQGTGETLTLDTISTFRNQIPQFWDLLEPHIADVSWPEISQMQTMLALYGEADFESADLATKIAADLHLLLDGWDSYTADGRAVVHAAVAYFLLADDDVPDNQPAGLDDDDLVVSAAFTALELVREASSTAASAQ